MSGQDWHKQIGDAREDLIVKNREHHEAQAAFDAALDAYIETRDAWRAAIRRLDDLEAFAPGAGDTMVRTEPT